jgi:hypothetical protein
MHAGEKIMQLHLGMIDKIQNLKISFTWDGVDYCLRKKNFHGNWAVDRKRYWDKHFTDTHLKELRVMPPFVYPPSVDPEYLEIVEKIEIYVVQFYKFAAQLSVLQKHKINIVPIKVVFDWGHVSVRKDGEIGFAVDEVLRWRLLKERHGNA